ncbi:MAG: ABC transporter permease [Saprospiraceae bacterium]|nr:ABC transporter permease [Saprospiraceae bacterium]
MWQNNFRLAWRALLRQRQHSLINLLGLAVSIAACLLLYRMVRYELSFDRQHRQYDRIVRVVTAESNSEGTDYTGGIPIPAMDAMQSGVPQFEHFARLHAFYPQISVPQTPGQKFATDGLHEVAVYIEPSFFRIFDWNWLAGDPLVALSEPKSAVLPQAVAFFTISYQAVKAATANPVNSLRNE